MHAVPAAPAPVTTTRTSSARLPTTRSAFSSAASSTIAVPCWSSWKTGMSSSARSRRSISKHRGAEMSSRLIPPNVGDTALTTRDDLVDVLRRQAQRVGVDAGELLEQQRLALHDGHRRLRPDVAEPEHRGPVGHDGDRVALHREVPGALGVLVDRLRHACDARRVGHREVVAGLDRHGAVHADLAPQVQLERPVGDRLDADAVDLLDRPHDRLAVRRVDARHGDVADDVRALDAHEVDRAEDAALVADRARDEPERARPLRQPDAHRDAVGRRRLEDGVTGVSHDARRAWARRGP